MKNILLFIGILISQSAISQLTSSSLPIIVINTGAAQFNDATIPDDPKILSSMGIINNGPGIVNNITDAYTDYNGSIGIETRGNSTQGYSKKTYSIELWDSFGQDTSASLLGMGKEEDWILHSMVIDKSQLRIPFSFDLAQRMGHYASNWRYVELIVDNDYRGIYLLCEKIKRDDDRVDIAKLDSDDLAGDSLTGGYILRIDWLDSPLGFESAYNSQSNLQEPMFFQYYYPKAANIKPEQVAYIEGYMNDFESALFDPTFSNSQGVRYNDYIDVTSFVDFFISNEFSKNSDGYKLSTYVHKDKDSKGGKLTAGPIWDFDQTYGMSTVCSCDDYTGWTYLQNQPACEDLETMPMWWQSFMSDTLFVNHLACRWNELRVGPMHLDSINQWIDDHEMLLGEALTRNFDKWLFIGEEIWAEPFPIPSTYAGEILQMKSWIANRIAWLDANITGNCQNDVVSTTELTELKSTVYPNPFTDILKVDVAIGTEVHVFNMQGQSIYQTKVTAGKSSLNLGELSSGTYLLKMLNGSQSSNQLIVKR